MSRSSRRRSQIGGVGLAVAALTGIILASPAATAAAAERPDLLITESDGSVLSLPGDAATTTSVAEVGANAWDTDVAPGGDLWVAASSQVWRVPADGGAAVSYPGYSQATGVAVADDGTVYVADFSASQIFTQSEDASAPVSLAAIQSPGQMSLNSDGNLLVASFSDGTVSRVTPNGEVTVVASGLSQPVDAVQGPDGSVFISEQNSGAIKEVATDGATPVEVANVGFGAFGLEIGSDGVIYANNFDTDQTFSIAADGTATAITSGLQTPYGLTGPGVAPTPQEIVFTSTAPTDATVGDVYTPAATGGGSGNPVTFSTTTPDVCSYDSEAGEVSFDAAGTCTVAADQAGGTAGDVTYADAEQVTQDIVVEVPELTISAGIDSAGPVNEAGWYRTPVTVTYTCGGGTGELDCPAPVTRANTASGFVLVRTVTDEAGDTATARTPLQVDTRGPVITTRRVGTAPYARTARPIRCTATDGRSGLDGTCTVTYGSVVRGPNGAARRTWTATATDIAGNTTIRTNSFTVTGKAPARNQTRFGGLG